MGPEDVGPEEESSRLLVEEAYSLALSGRFDESRRLLEDLATIPDGRLCRARIGLAGVEGGHTEAREELERLLQEGGTGSWRAAIDLARLARDEGRPADAAALLKRAIDGFRRVPAPPGPARERLASLLSAEVADLECHAGPATARPRKTGPEIPAPDPQLLMRLIELGKRLAGETDPDQVLRIVLHEAIELTETERGFIVLVAGDDFEVALAENLDWTEVEKPSFEVSRTIIRGVLRDGKPIALALPDAPDDQPFHRSLVEIGVRSVACVPILHNDTTLGVLYLDGCDPSHTFSGPVERLLDLLATQAGGALDNARAHLAKARALEAAEESLRRHRSESEHRIGYGEIIGSSEEMQEVYRKLDLIAPTELPVLILGETGTGKELAARLIHARGPRASREFIATNCAGIAETLLESELFGHERGAFTGADRSRPGLFELAHGGTMFLDEIGDMSLRMQADLLRVLQSGEVRRVGGRETFHLDIRVVAATHRDLGELQRRGEFRQDLYYRLNVLTLSLPALRERFEDVPLLAHELLHRYMPAGRTPPRFSDRAMGRLVDYSWPGNVRELQNVLRRVSVMGVEVIEERHLPHEVLQSAPRPIRAGSMRRAESDAVRQALAAARGNKAKAARILGVDRKTLYAKLKRIGSGAEGHPV